MTTPNLHICVDSRERGRILDRLRDLSGVTLETVEMELGDYILPGGLVIERKSATDLILSVVDKSLWDKVAKLRTQFERVVYIIEGDLYTARFHQQALDIHRALAVMTVNYGVTILPSPDADNSGMLIYLMGLASQAGPGREERPGKPSIRRDAQLYLLGALPGVDADRAEALLRRFGSAQAALNASAEELIEVDGLDNAAAERIVSVLRYGQ